MSRPQLAPLLCGLLFLGACSDLGTRLDFSSIADPQERWEAYGLEDYTILQTLTCFCADGGVPFLVTVRENSIVAIVNAHSGVSIPSSEWGRFKTVDGLFDLVNSIDPDNVASMRVAYDSRFGIPTEIYVDPSQNIADEEYGYVTELVSPILAE